MNKIFILIFSLAILGCPPSPTDDEPREFKECDVSIARLDNTRATLKFSRPYMNFVFKHKEVLGENFDKYDWENATFSLKIKSGEALVADIVSKNYNDRVEFDLADDKDYTLTFSDVVFSVAEKEGGKVNTINLTYKGLEILVQKKEIYEAKKTFDGVEYSLTWADDFNYHFNGLDYNSYAEYNSVKADNTKDLEAWTFDQHWQPENPTAPHKRRDGCWDMRSNEVKNGSLHIKVLSMVDGGINIGHINTKKITTFTDLFATKLLTGSCVSKKSYKQGYFEARLRVKSSGYNVDKKNNPTPIDGPWYAFWVFGPKYEYDIMEFRQERPKFDQTTHWHNDWASGTTKDRLFAKSTAPTDYENEFWTMGLLWTPEKFVYFVNGEKKHEFIKKTENSGIYTKYGEDTWVLVTETTTGGGPEKEIKSAPQLNAISDQPMKIYFSTEVAYNSWAGVLGLNNEWKLPTWMEVDYFALYGGVE